jgi:hypothetical protein
MKLLIEKEVTLLFLFTSEFSAEMFVFFCHHIATLAGNGFEYFFIFFSNPSQKGETIGRD